MRKPALLASALVCLAIFFGWKARSAWLAPPPVESAGPGPADLWQPGDPVPDPPPPPEISGAVSVIAAKPLFRPDRLPHGEQGGASAGRNYETELSRLSLIGTLTFGGELKGIVVSKGGSQTERWEVKSGDQLSGFKVKEVLVDGLSLTADGREFMLPLYAGPPIAGSIRTEGPRATPSAASKASAPPPVGAPAAVRPGIRNPRPTYVPGSR